MLLQLKPSDIRRQLNSIIYVGSSYIAKAENNLNNLIDHDFIDKLKIKLFKNQFWLWGLNNYVRKKINFDFPGDSITESIANPFENMMGNDIPFSCDPKSETYEVKI